MSYALTLALQQALYTRLTTAEGLAGIAVYDALPSGAVPPLYIAIGPEIADELATPEGPISLHRVKISVVATGGGFGTAKAIAGAIIAAMDAPLTLSQGHASTPLFQRAVAQGTASSGAERRIDLTFRIRLEP